MTLPCTTFCRNGSGATDYRKRPTGPYHIPRVAERVRCQGLQELDTIYHVLQKAPGATDCRKLPTMYHALQKVVSCSAFSRLHPYTISRRNGRRGVAELVCINRNGVSQEVLAGSRDAIGVQDILITTTTIYRNTKTPSAKRQATTRYAYEDDPTFLKFRSAVWANCKRNDEPNIDNSKLYALWYVSATFHRHWDEPPSKKTSNDMVFILGHNFLSDVQSRMVMLAWLKRQFPNLSAAKFGEWEERMFWPTWARIQASVQEARDRKNARRREKRRKKKMKNTQNAKRTFTLKNRILEALKLHPMTTALLAKKLNAHPKAVDGHLSRMSKADRAKVVKLGRGLYALPGAVYSGPVQTVQSGPQEPRPESIFSTDLTEGVGEWESPVLEYRNSYTVDIPDEDAVSDAPDLKSAEPKWSREW